MMDDDQVEGEELEEGLPKEDAAAELEDELETGELDDEDDDEEDDEEDLHAHGLHLEEEEV